MDEINSENNVGEDIEYNDASTDKQESESENFVKTLEKGKTPLTRL